MKRQHLPFPDYQAVVSVGVCVGRLSHPLLFLSLKKKKIYPPPLSNKKKKKRARERNLETESEREFDIIV